MDDHTPVPGPWATSAELPGGPLVQAFGRGDLDIPRPRCASFHGESQLLRRAWKDKRCCEVTRSPQCMGVQIPKLTISDLPIPLQARVNAIRSWFGLRSFHFVCLILIWARLLSKWSTRSSIPPSNLLTFGWISS